MLRECAGIALAAAFLWGCSDRSPIKDREVLRVVSPSGECEARVYEVYEPREYRNTQVLLMFKGKWPGSGGGSGAVSFNEAELGLSLQWTDSNTLEISYPADTEYQRNPSGERIQYMDNIVDVKLVPVISEKGT